MRKWFNLTLQVADKTVIKSRDRYYSRLKLLVEVMVRETGRLPLNFEAKLVLLVKTEQFLNITIC